MAKSAAAGRIRGWRCPGCLAQRGERRCGPLRGVEVTHDDVPRRLGARRNNLGTDAVRGCHGSVPHCAGTDDADQGPPGGSRTMSSSQSPIPSGDAGHDRTFGRACGGRRPPGRATPGQGTLGGHTAAHKGNGEGQPAPGCAQDPAEGSGPAALASRSGQGVCPTPPGTVGGPSGESRSAFTRSTRRTR